MRKFLTVAVALLATVLTSCTSSDEEMYADGEKTFTVKVGGDFIFESFTRTGLAENTMYDIWVFDYMDGKFIQAVHQVKGYDEFGSPKITLRYGRHNLYFVASAGTGPTVMQQTSEIVWQNIGDTFWNKLEVNVTANSETTLGIVLDRAVTMLRLKSLDNMAEGTKSVTVIPKTWYYGIKVTTGQPAGIAANKAVQCNIGSGDAKVDVSLFGFAPSEEEFYTDITFFPNDGGSETPVKTMTGVPFKSNRITVASGMMFMQQSQGGSNTGTYRLYTNDNWSLTHTMSW